jgi:hypothetical protein
LQQSLMKESWCNQGGMMNMAVIGVGGDVGWRRDT